MPRFALAYRKFVEKTTLEPSSRGLITNYSRSLAYIALQLLPVVASNQRRREEINGVAVPQQKGEIKKIAWQLIDKEN